MLLLFQTWSTGAQRLAFVDRRHVEVLLFSIVRPFFHSQRYNTQSSIHVLTQTHTL